MLDGRLRREGSRVRSSRSPVRVQWEIALMRFAVPDRNLPSFPSIPHLNQNLPRLVADRQFVSGAV